MPVFFLKTYPSAPITFWTNGFLLNAPFSHSHNYLFYTKNSPFTEKEDNNFSSQVKWVLRSVIRVWTDTAVRRTFASPETNQNRNIYGNSTIKKRRRNAAVGLWSLSGVSFRVRTVRNGSIRCLLQSANGA